MLDVVSKSGHLRAGISLSVFRLVDALLAVNSFNEFVLVVDQEFEMPSAWTKKKNVQVLRPSKALTRYKVQWESIFARFVVRRYKIDQWLFTSSRGAPFFPCKQLVVVHDILPLTHPGYFTRRQVINHGSAMRTSLPRVDFIFANSQTTKTELQRFLQISESKIKVIPFDSSHSLPPASQESIASTSNEQLGIPFSKFFFSLSTVEPRKNVIAILKAAAHIREQLLAAGCGIAIAGAKGWKTEAIFQAYQELQLDGIVHFLGYVPDEQIPLLFAKCEAFICASLTEGFGLPVIEAHVFGAPVISSTGGSLPEVCGPAALTFDPTDINALANHILHVLEHTEERQQRVQAGREHAKKFSWEKCADVILETMQSL